MADIRINSLPSTATSFNTDDYIAIDGASGGTRKMLAATLPLTDVTLGGTSGPSVKASLSARAPRQGLVFDGTAGAYSGLISGPSTNDFTLACWVNPASFAASGYLFGNSQSNSIYVGVRVTTGAIFTGLSGGAAFGDTGFSLTAGKQQLLVRVRSGSTALWYLNGVLVQSGVSDSNNYSGAFQYYGSANSSAAIFTGTLIPLIYNRALSASEVVSLYEAGAPAGADYNSASNTLLNTSTALNAYSTSFTTFTGASATGFTASDSTASKSPRVIFPLSGTLVAGRRYRAKFTATLTAMSSVNLWQSDSSYAGLANLGAVSSGSNEFTFTATSSVNAMMLLCTTDGSVGTHSVVISGMAVDTPGLLLAPDAAQAGGGLTWYDTSGNAANITLPASGVSWNVPTSGYVTSGSSLNLSAGGTNQNITLTPSGTGVNTLNGGTTFATSKYLRFGTQFFALGESNTTYLFSGGAGGYVFRNGNDTATLAAITNSGNFLIGTTIDGGNGKLQLATHLTSAGGIGFGADLSLYRANTGFLILNDASAALDCRIGLYNQGTQRGLFEAYNVGSAVYMGAASAGWGTIITSGNQATALTLDSSQRCILAGALRLNNAYVAGAPTATGYVTLQDSAGNTYKVLVGT